MKNRGTNHSGTDWLRSAEVRKALGISTCDLPHLREDGVIKAEKRGNAYCYSEQDLLALRGKKLKRGMGVL